MKQEEKIKIISDFVLDKENFNLTLEIFMLAICKICTDTNASDVEMSQVYENLGKTGALKYTLK